ncbi:MAG: hypothetical protein Q8R92_03985 [Deltaproteobacteria bacterium]|nr:hypothetical protein [Deltaproteobacteria bacterium]
MLAMGPSLKAAAAMLFLFAAAGCAADQNGPAGATAGARPPLMSHAGPEGWELRILHEPPPYWLVEYLEPALPGVPDESRGRVRVGKAWQQAGRSVVTSLCDAQWRSETVLAQPATGREPIEARRGGVVYTGWEARRALPDGSKLKLRALCGSSDVGTAFFFLSAPDESALYEPVWEHLLDFNLGAGDR